MNEDWSGEIWSGAAGKARSGMHEDWSDENMVRRGRCGLARRGEERSG